MYQILIIMTSLLILNCSSKKVLKEDLSQNKEQEKSTYIITKDGKKLEKVIKSDEAWKAQLSESEYYVLRKKGTEMAFTSNLNENKNSGYYKCTGCNTILFDSETKFDSGTGWPSFYKPHDATLIDEEIDYKIGYARTEVLCAVCGGHLGHVFNDGPKPTGLRYCINGVALKFDEK